MAAYIKDSKTPFDYLVCKFHFGRLKDAERTELIEACAKNVKHLCFIDLYFETENVKSK